MISSGILMYRFKEAPEVLLVHPGGPFFINKDPGTWSIPKGELLKGESAKEAGLREFKEELGVDLHGEMIELSPVVQKGGKKVYAWAIEGDLDPEAIVCNTFSLEWPPKSGKIKEFAEIDRAEWFPIAAARLEINEAQILFLEELMQKLGYTGQV